MDTAIETAFGITILGVFVVSSGMIFGPAIKDILSKDDIFSKEEKFFKDIFLKEDKFFKEKNEDLPWKTRIKDNKIPSELIVTSVLDKNVNGPSKLISRRRNHGIRSYRHNRLGRKSSFPLICLMAMLSLTKKV